MRSNDRVIIAAMMIVAFLIVVFLAGFIALVVIEDSARVSTRDMISEESTLVPVSSVTGDSYNVYSEENKGEIIEITEDSSVDPNMESWNQYVEAQNRQVINEEYENILNNREDMLEAEAEMESWCDQLNSNSCLSMKYTWMDHGCRPVEIECKKFNDDDVCYRYEVDIIDKFVDEEYCES